MTGPCGVRQLVPVPLARLHPVGVGVGDHAEAATGGQGEAFGVVDAHGRSIAPCGAGFTGAGFGWGWGCVR